MSIINKVSSGILFLCFVFSVSSHAQIQPIEKNRPKLTVTTSAVANDNFNPTLGEDISAAGGIISGYGALVMEQGALLAGIKYSGSHQYSRLETDNALLEDPQTFNTLSAIAFARMHVSKAIAFDLEAGRTQMDEKFATGLSRFRKNIINNDTLNLDTASATIYYGTEPDTRYLALGIRSIKTTYDDNNAYSNLFNLRQNQAQFDMVLRKSTAGFAVKLDVSDDDFEDILRPDSTLYRALIGLDWKPSGKTKLQALIGQFRRELDNAETNTGLTWQIDYLGTPREDIELKFSSVRSSQQADLENATESVIETHIFSTTYRYSQQWQYALNVSYQNVDYVSQNPIPSLTETSVQFDTTAALSDHSGLRLSYQFRQSETQDKFIDYSQNEIRLSWHYVF